MTQKKNNVKQIINLIETLIWGVSSSTCTNNDFLEHIVADDDPLDEKFHDDIITQQQFESVNNLSIQIFIHCQDDDLCIGGRQMPNHLKNVMKKEVIKK